ncbi:MAG TPA: hypothetical protein VG408_05770 [Actinomycetota bacterium]|nr:hypothetical protein [Actinomycetota bacterium]
MSVWASTLALRSRLRHIWETNDAGQRYGGNFLAGDLTCTGRIDIVQLWRTDPGTVSMSVYRWQGADSGYVGRQFDMTQPWASTNWLVVR